jgi:hypothetical protein
MPRCPNVLIVYLSILILAYNTPPWSLFPPSLCTIYIIIASIPPNFFLHSCPNFDCRSCPRGGLLPRPFPLPTTLSISFPFPFSAIRFFTTFDSISMWKLLSWLFSLFLPVRSYGACSGACTFTIFSFPSRFPCACVHAHAYTMYVQSTSLGRDKVRVCYCQIVILTVGLYGGHELVARAGFNGLGLGSLLIGCFQITLLPSLQYIL